MIKMILSWLLHNIIKKDDWNIQRMHALWQCSLQLFTCTQIQNLLSTICWQLIFERIWMTILNVSFVHLIFFLYANITERGLLFSPLVINLVFLSFVIARIYIYMYLKSIIKVCINKGWLSNESKSSQINFKDLATFVLTRRRMQGICI